MINTVLGAIDSDRLGTTLVHEHILFGYAGWHANDTITPFNREECIKISVNALKELKAFGVTTFVDATPNDCGRDATLLKEISEKSGVTIICSTGLYTETEGGSAYFKFRVLVSGDAISEIHELFAKELTSGIGTTGIKAGVIKVGTGHGQITQYEEMVLKAAARAQKETGTSIMTHTDGGTMGQEQIDILTAEGADPKRIAIGHICGSSDINYHVSLLQKDVYIAFDKLGMEYFPTDQSDTVRKACIIELIRRGLTNKILLSHDSIRWWLGKQFITPSPSHIFLNIIPALKKEGITDEQINTMLIENPRNFLAGE